MVELLIEEHKCLRSSNTILTVYSQVYRLWTPSHNLIRNAYLNRENKILNLKFKTDNSIIISAKLDICVYFFEFAISFGTAYKSSV